MKIFALRTALAAGAALAFSLVAAQSADQKVTFQAKAATAKALFPALSRAAGKTFTTSPQTEDEVLLIDVKDVRLDDLMKQIAKVAAAEWKEEAEGFRLIRSQGAQNQQEREYFEARAAKIKSEQDRISQDLAKLRPLTPAEARAAIDQQKRQADEVASALREGRQPPMMRFDNAQQNANPTARLSMKLVAGLNPIDLARMPAASRVVFSSSPTRSQRPLPPAASRAIADFVREYQIWLEAQPAAAPAEPGAPQFVGPGGALSPMENGLGKILVVVSRIMFGSDLQCELLVADGNGNIFARQFRILSTVDGSAFGRIAAPASGDEKPIELSQSAKDHAAFMAALPNRGGADFFVTSGAPIGGRGGSRTAVSVSSIALAAPAMIGGGGNAAPRPPVTDEWRKILTQPEKNDPLGFVVSELYAGVAAQRGANLVASLPDSLLINLSSRSVGKITPSQLLEASKREFELNVDESNGWLTVMPKFPSSVRENRVDRSELGLLLSSIQKDGRMALDTLARYANSRRNPAPPPGFDGRYVGALFPFAFGEFNQASFNWRILQLYAQLSVPQRRLLADGATLNLGNLSPGQAAIVASMVFDDMAGPIQMQDPREGPARAETRQSFAFAGNGGMMTFGGSGGRLSDERTEFLPNGVPSNGELTVQINTQEAVYASKKDGSADPRFFTAETYGTYMGIVPNLLITGTNAPSIPQYDQFRPSSIQTIDFHFQLSPRATMDKQLRDSWFAPGSADVAYGGLSDDFRARAEEVAKRMKDTRGQISIGGGGGVRPPA